MENEILKEAKNLQKLPKMIILRPKIDHFSAFLASFNISLSSLQHPHHKGEIYHPEIVYEETNRIILIKLFSKS